MEKEKKKINLKDTVGFIIYIAVVFVITYLVITYVGQRTEAVSYTHLTLPTICSV